MVRQRTPAAAPAGRAAVVGGTCQAGAVRVTPGDLVAERYLLERLVEVEGGRRVYRATDQHDGRTVELRVPDDDADAAVAGAMRAEAQAMDALAARGMVVPVHALVEWRGAPVLVTECVPGVSLAELVRTSAPLPPAEAIAVGRALIAALPAAGAPGGMVHRAAVRTADGSVVITGLRPAPAAPGGVDPAVPAVAGSVFTLLTAREPAGASAPAS